MPCGFVVNRLTGHFKIEFADRGHEWDFPQYRPVPIALNRDLELRTGLFDGDFGGVISVTAEEIQIDGIQIVAFLSEEIMFIQLKHHIVASVEINDLSESFGKALGKFTAIPVFEGITSFCLSLKMGFYPYDNNIRF
jgi:hypothetical protein